MTNPAVQYCPICHKAVSYSGRYPRYVCKNCFEKTTDNQGRKVEFYNKEVMGFGCKGYYVKDGNTDQPYETNTCYIDGVKCCAEAAYFGGIVIIATE